jgi:large subunit ribosomal protein L16
MNSSHYKKLRKFKLKGYKIHDKKLYFGFYGLKSLETGRINSNVVKSLLDIVKRKVKLHKGKFWFSLNDSIPVTQSPIGTRMGKGKGNISHHVAFVKKGQILCELSVSDKSIAFDILAIAASKLPVKCKIVVY